MVAVALSMVAKKSNQFSYQPKMDELKMTPHIDIKQEQYSTIKKHEILSFAATLMETEDTVLSEISQT